MSCKEIGERIRYLREINNYTQEAFYTYKGMGFHLLWILNRKY